MKVEGRIEPHQNASSPIALSTNEGLGQVGSALHCHSTGDAPLLPSQKIFSSQQLWQSWLFSYSYPCVYTLKTLYRLYESLAQFEASIV
jgi:hypothetical protein